MINTPIISLFLTLIIMCGIVFLLIQLIRVSFFAIDALKIYINNNRVVKKIPPQESLPPNPRFPKNELGETYGSGLSLTPYEREPDLLKAIGVDGTEGYIRLTEADGPQPKTPEEAIEMMSRPEYKEKRVINLYESDGITVIGKFEISPGRSFMIDKNDKMKGPSK
jgi:hypothetical protein